MNSDTVTMNMLYFSNITEIIVILYSLYIYKYVIQ